MQLLQLMIANSQVKPSSHYLVIVYAILLPVLFILFGLALSTVLTSETTVLGISIKAQANEASK